MEEIKRTIEEIEAEILVISGTDYEEYNGWADNAELRNHVEALLKSRCDLLNRMFNPTTETIARFQILNNHLRNLTLQACKRLAEINAVEYYMASPDDDDEEVESWVRFVFNDEHSVLKLEDDDYYGSNFTLMIKVLAELYQSKGQERIIYLHNGRDCLDDGQSWMDTPFDRWEAAVRDIVICYAVHDLTNHKAYSVPDLLRLNDFRTEARITFQTIARQDGTRINHNGIR